MDDTPIEHQPPHDRRRFFATGLRRLLQPLADQIEKRLPITEAIALPLLRPPGAIPEPAFLQTCLRCGRCAEACPAHAIQLVAADDDARRGTPFIRPSDAACVICDDLACMKVCPSGALQLVDRMAIRIGLAVWDGLTCLRANHDPCTECLDRCPLGMEAIQLAGNAIRVIAPDDLAGAGTGRGCTGCGVCEQYCPTLPKAIRIVPI